MVGKGRHQVLGLWSPDPVLSMVAPIGLAASVGTALVVDLASTGRQPGRSLADLVSEGPALAELSPGRSGIAYLPGGEVDLAVAISLTEQFLRHWPAVVIRVPSTGHPFATVPVIPLFPGRFSPVPVPARGVWQPVSGGAAPPGPGPVLPRLRAGLVRRLLAGQLPRHSRWMMAWRPVWEMPWA
jgi:hypothetical protein